MKSNSASKISLCSLDDLLGVPEEVKDQVVQIPLYKLRPFSNHPFLVKDDAKMAETVESIKQHGILVPGIVREVEGGYEIIAGHRRSMGAKLAGLSEIPMIIKNLTDDEATVIMVDSNIQREDLSYKEKAFAYKLKYEALKNLGDKVKGRTDEALSEQLGESRNTIQRYIRLTFLIPGLLEMVDDKKLGYIAASDISYLNQTQQTYLYEFMIEKNISPSGTQAQQLKEYSQKGELTNAVMELLLNKTEKKKVTLNTDSIKKYFPPDYSTKQMTDTIISLLENWSEDH